MALTNTGTDVAIAKALSELNCKIRKLGSGGGSGTSDATEATLQAILSELRDNNSLNEILVTDTAGVVHIRRTTVDADTGVITTQYLNPQTQAVSVPTFPIVSSTSSIADTEFFPARLIATPTDTFFVRSFFDGTTTTYTRVDTGATIANNLFEPFSSTDDWELLEVELVDDVAGNGTGAIVPYSELYKVAVDGTRTLIATVDNKGANYTLLGTRRSANEIGLPTKTAANQLLLDGASWSPSAMTSIFSYIVISVASALTPPTYKGSNNVSVPLFAGESGEYNVIDGTTSFSSTNILITAQAGDKIKISYSEIV